MQELELTTISSTPREAVALSIVLPVYNEVDNLDRLHAELQDALEQIEGEAEIIFVNDGSRDGSAAKLYALASEHPNVTFVDLRRNFGQTAALVAGADLAQGEVVIFMDADLQNDPADILKLHQMIMEGNDVVSGWRRTRHDRFITRRIPSMLANSLIAYVTGVPLHDFGCTLKAYRREVLQEIRLYGEMHRFIPVLAQVAGAKIAEIEVNHRPRKFGQSKYGLGRTIKVLLDLITVKFLLTYRTSPMYLFGGVGLILIALSFIAITGAIAYRFTNGISINRTPLPELSAMLFTLGVQSILLGLTTELVVRTYHESQGKPIYSIRSIFRQPRHIHE